MKINKLSPLLLCLAGCAQEPTPDVPTQFTDVTDDAGITSLATWKYGGPTLADFNLDGRYDLVLLNHHDYKAQYFLSSGDRNYDQKEPVMENSDTHGIAAGDFDGDGHIDLVVSVGGGNGTNPKPPRLLRSTGTGFEDVTEGSGIERLGARGRSVRWIDLDTDGDLDLVSINAQQLPSETGPRNILFENLGDGRFEYRDSGEFEQLEAERVLITDFNNDHLPDLVTYEPLSLLQGTGEFHFENVTAEWLPGVSDEQRLFTMAAAEADIDNDGDMDLYVSRGKTYYQIANNALELDTASGRMDLRDEGNEGEDGTNFAAGDSVVLSDFWHWPRGVDLTLPVYLGEAQHPIGTPADPVTVTAAEAAGFPEELTENGWYLGTTGEGQWRLAWKLNGNLAWDIRASITGVTAVQPDFEPATLGKADLLLINEGDHFRNAPEMLPAESADNNWGVITGDFDNDEDADFFVYRFGRLHGRVEDVLFTNDGGNFVSRTGHGANNIAAGGHGDMGAPFDYDRDGWLDILSGSDNHGYWHLYRNTTGDAGNENRSMTIHVGKSPEWVDAHGAEIYVRTESGTQLLKTGSRGAVHSQSLHEFVHVGLGKNDVASVRVRWRSGEEETLENLAAGKTHVVGTYAAPASSEDADFTFLDRSLPLEERVEILVSQMTTEEKISQLEDQAAAVPRLQVPAYGWWNEALHGVARNGKATIFPQIIGLGATFDVDLTERVASAISTEARAKFAVAQEVGNHGKYAGLTFWSPNINIFRDPRWGRGQETFGEDPLLTASMGSAFVRGIQGDDPDYLKAAAAAKHYLVHSGPESVRHEFDAVPSKQDLHETYMPAFKALVTEAGVEGVMAAYNAVYGKPMVANEHFLQEVLREDWRFDGYITSDCGGVGGVARSHHYTTTVAEAAAASVKAGTNLNCGDSYRHLGEALQDGLVTEELIHESTKQLFKTRFRLGMFDDPAENPYASIGPEHIHSEEHVALAREAARKSIVLLKNRNNILPLSKNTRVPYLTGPFANSSDMLMGSYYGVTSNLVTILEGITDALAPGTSLNYRSGALPFHENINPKNYAPYVAAYSDVTIAVVGLTADREGEEVDAIASDHEGDKRDLQLPANQVAYIKQLADFKKEKPLVLIVASGSPVALDEIEEHCDAILQIWYPGEQGGHAVADVLFGDFSPSGHLPLTFPKNIDQVPPYDDYSMQGRTYKYMTEEPAYPFGFGLTYSTTELSNIRLSDANPSLDTPLNIEVTIANSGEYDIDEVVQVYVSPLVVDGGLPSHSLKAFRRVPLAVGERKTVTFSLAPEALKVINENGDSVWRAGEYRISVGNSSPGALSSRLGAAIPQEAIIVLD